MASQPPSSDLLPDPPHGSAVQVEIMTPGATPEPEPASTPLLGPVDPSPLGTDVNAPDAHVPVPIDTVLSQ